jgi:two-component system, sensor histidine kinase and response regulator
MKKPMASASSVFDIQAALDRLGGDEELLKEVGELFLIESKDLLNDIGAAIQANDMAQLERSAHTIKGSIANFGGGPAFDSALQLELLGRSRNPENTLSVYQRLLREVQLLQQEVREYCA